jgi:8-oxo-dGTP pyrophosphatase MutT (NUDIX family)
MSLDGDLRARLRDALGPDPLAALPPATVAAGVLVPIVERGGAPTLVLTRRSEHLTRHPGEISFPGGIADDGDGSLEATALRELEEELGVPAGAVEVLGALPPVHTVVSGVLITPFVGWLAEPGEFRPDAFEIAEVLEYGLADLIAAERPIELAHEDRVHRGWAYPMGDDVVWGATGQVLHSLLVALAGERV